ncbi:RHS repeat-associated core domain-containing protein [Variovorax sp. W6]|uniref:RHS repeat-associated core domain-containing protein n=1 Tax=Variovorax sp. W6 TaxID=3093895 RepID=UPI003D80688F
MLAMGIAVSALAQGTVVPPNGTLSNEVIDLSVQTPAGSVEWRRSFNGTGWRFNRHWDGVSASYKPVMTQNTGGGAPGMSHGSQGGAPATCWIWVDEDWQPGDGLPDVTVPIGGRLPALAIPPETYLPLNRSYNQTASPLDTVITTGFASGCASIGGNLVGNSSEVIEGYRRQSTLYVGAGGTYIFKNRYTLKKQPIQKLAPFALPIGGSVSFVGLTSVASGWRWVDRAGDWAEYDDEGRISRYGDKNNNTVWLQRNAAGQIVRIIDGGTTAVSGNVIITLHYDAKGYLTQAKDWPQAGNSLDLPQRSVTYTYDTQGRMTGVTDVRGNTTLYEYDSKQRLTKTTDPRGGETRLTYEAEGTSVKSMTTADGGVTEYGSSWDSTKKLFYSKVTGPATAAGRRVDDYSHDRAGDLVKYEINGRVETEIKRDPSARTETRTNARGFATTYTRDEFEQVTQIVYPDGAKTSTSYEPRMLNAVEETDELGVKTRFEYDDKGNRIRKTEALGLPEQRVTEYARNGAGRPTNITRKGRTEANGTVTPDTTWLFDYDGAGQVASVTDPEGNKRIYVYNRIGQLVKYADPRGNTTTYEIDAKGNLTKVTNALGHVRTLVYDSNNNLATSTDGRGKAIQMAYDAMNQRVQTINAVGGKAQVNYDKLGQQVGQTDEDGRIRTSGYDNFQRIASESDALANVTQYGYRIADGSGAGEVGSLVAPTDIQYPTFRKLIKYDGRERPTTETVLNAGASGTQTSISANVYDAKGQLLAEQDAYGKSRSSKYDPLGQKVEVVDALGGKSQTVYDSRGNLIQVTDVKGNVTRLDYDRSSRLISETLPLGQVTRYSYDPAGNLAELEDPTGAKKQFTYDAANRITGIKQVKAGTLARSITAAWDAENHMTAWSDTNATKPIGQQTTSATLVYDDVGRKTEETVTYPNPAGGTYQLSYGYQYSSAGKKTSLKWADGTTLGYSYSQHGELESVTVPGEGTLSVNRFRWLVPTKITLPGGGTQDKSWDGLLNLESLKSRTPGQQTTLTLTNTYSKLQEIKSANRSDSAGGLSKIQNSSYGYDDELRLIQVKTDAGGLLTETETLELDGVANRTRHSRTGGSVWSYDANNRLLSRPGPDGGSTITYQWDANGNQVGKTEGTRTTNFVYDGDNRLIEVKEQNGNLIARYDYDPLNRRTWKEQYRDRAGNVLEQASRTYYLYSEEGLIAEATQAISLNADKTSAASEQPAIVTQYGPRPNSAFTTGILFIKTKNTNGENTFAYYQHNHLQVPLQATDKSGNVVWTASYDAFGQAVVNTLAPTQNKPTITSNLRLPGQFEDSETGLHYNWNRYYEPQTGRYSSADPIGLNGGINRHAYVGGKPVVDVDPTGEFGLAGAAGGAVVNAGIQLGLNMILGGGSFANAFKCIDFRKVMTAAAIGFVGPTAFGNKIMPRLFGKGEEFPIGSIAKTAGVGTAANWLTGKSDAPPLNLYSADECECRNIKSNIHNSVGHVGQVLTGLVF